MIERRYARLPLLAALVLSACDGGRAPTSPTPVSFLEGTWEGTLTIVPTGETGASGGTTWTFDVVPQTGLQSFNVQAESAHPWFANAFEGIAALAPSPTPPTQISTQGDYASPRGCHGTFGSFGTADARRIEASFHGVDCERSFDGSVVLTKK